MEQQNIKIIEIDDAIPSAEDFTLQIEPKNVPAVILRSNSIITTIIVCLLLFFFNQIFGV